MSRVACACIPHFEIAVFAPDEAPDAPVAVADLAMKTAPLRGVNAVAERQGVRVGMVASRALVVCPQLRLVAPDAAKLQRTETRILQALSTLSPALDSDGLAWRTVGIKSAPGFTPATRISAWRQRICRPVPPCSSGSDGGLKRKSRIA